ncbi:unnamed protein product [Nezara viridula]|uniref:Uncharacterized protein n=1 Tax=Nezara viridula TaxID=85310 RepID=A0A9P0HEG8_NEZVI|nr:unnamed protein product [Nezara viridula]
MVCVAKLRTIDIARDSLERPWSCGGGVGYKAPSLMLLPQEQHGVEAIAVWVRLSAGGNSSYLLSSLTNDLLLVKTWA